MHSELDKLIALAPAQSKESFAKEMKSFYALFNRFMGEKKDRLDWSCVKSPSDESVVPYATLAEPKSTSNLSKLAVLKLNGGLGTTMGCVGPKSAIEVRDGMTFLDLTVRQIEYLNVSNNVSVPLILMNSFNTDNETRKIIQKYQGQDLNIWTFNQSRFPRVQKEALLPCPTNPIGQGSDWYPPGHGDLFEALNNSGTLDRLLADGKEYLFVSNVDNLGATVDLKILDHLVESGSEFIMEVTNKTKADIKGGTLIEYKDSIRLLELAQVPAEHVSNMFT